MEIDDIIKAYPETLLVLFPMKKHSFRTRLKNFIIFDIKILTLSSFLLSQLFISEILLYKNNNNNISLYGINIAQADTSDAWYDGDWLYRKEVTLTGSTGDLTDYPMKLRLGYIQDKMNSDFSDLRFVNSVGTVLYDYYIEFKVDSDYAIVWVEVPSLPTSGASFFMYYGNSSAVSASDGDAVFSVFDDFNDSSIGAEWTVLNPDGNQAISESGTSLSMQTDGAEASDLDISTGNQDAPRITQSISGDFVVETKITTTNAYYDLTGILIWKDSQNFYAFGKGLISGSERIWRRQNIADTVTDTAYGTTAYTADTVYLRIVRSGTTVTCYHSSDFISWDKAFSETFASDDPLSVGFVRFDNTTRTYSGSVDWFLAGDYTASEPEPSWGIEESYSPASLSSFLYRKAITIDHTKVSSDLTNFPILLNLSSDTDLASHTQSDGDDILFTLSSIDWKTGNQNDKLPHEIESYDSTTGELQAWINIPNPSSISDTTLYMYYGNSTITNQQNKTAVWDSNTKMVQHLSESPANGARGHYDSTQYRNDGAPYNFTGSDNSTTDAEGHIAGSDLFNTGDGYDFVNCGNDDSLDITEKITLEAWIRVDADASYQSIVGRGGFSDAY